MPARECKVYVRFRTSSINLVVGLFWFVASGNANAAADATFQLESLTRENIASQALQVAQTTQTTGRCYAAVCKALKSLSVNLHGASAYEAKDLLLQDNRFVPLAVSDVDQLELGDIIVFNRSDSHPDGHISVYQGNYTEASDHVSPVTHTKAYGGATVFRLRENYLAAVPMIPIAPQVAPDFSTTMRQDNKEVEQVRAGEPPTLPGKYDVQAPYGLRRTPAGVKSHNKAEEWGSNPTLRSTRSDSKYNAGTRSDNWSQQRRPTAPALDQSDQSPSSDMQGMQAALRNAGRRYINRAERRAQTTTTQRLTKLLFSR